MTGKMKYPKFPDSKEYTNPIDFITDIQDWQDNIKLVIINRIKKDSVMMGEDIASYFDIRPFLEALK